jgi:hypothetical protein
VSGALICPDCSNRARISAGRQELVEASRMVAVCGLHRLAPRLRAHSDAGRRGVRRGSDARASALGEDAVTA